MGKHVLVAPDGTKHIIEAPDGATPEEVMRIGPQLIQQAQAAERAKPMEGGDYAKGLARTIAQGATLNTGDEITAAIRATLGGGSGASFQEDFGENDASNAPEAQSGPGWGDRYTKALAEERASIDRFAEQNPKTAIAANLGGALATAPLLPMATVAKGAGALKTAGNFAANAAGYGAASGFAAGENGLVDRATNAGKSAALSAALAGPVGGLMGRVAGKADPVNVAARNAGEAQQTARAAEHLGIALPKAAATNDTTGGAAIRGAAGALSSVPVVGAPLVKASRTAIDQMDEAAQNIAGAYRGGFTGARHPSTPLEAGEAAKRSLTEWIGPKSQDITAKAYDKVRAAMPAGATMPLSKTRTVAQRLLTEDAQAASRVNSNAVSLVMDAIERPGGLSYEGLQRLRTNIGAMLDDAFLPEAGTTKPALKRLYGALTEDITTGINGMGGPKAISAWTKANRLSESVAKRREALTKIIGDDPAARSPEAIVDRLVTMAGNRSTADIQKLMQARKSMGSDAWDEVASAAIERLGRGVDGEFNPTNFMKGYKNLTENGRNALFSSTNKGNLKAELDSLAKVSERFKELRDLSNSSKTGAVNTLLLSGGAYASGLTIPALVAIGKGYLVSHMLARPARVREIRRVEQALFDSLKKGGESNTLKMAVRALSNSVADEDGTDAEQVFNGIMSALRSL